MKKLKVMTAVKPCKIPLFQITAGNRCVDQRLPEEINRHTVDHAYDLKVTLSSSARDYALHEGLPTNLVIKTGSVMFEVLTHCSAHIHASDVFVRQNLSKVNYFVVSTHLRANIESPQSFAKFVPVLNAVAEADDVLVIVSAHAEIKKRFDAKCVKVYPHLRLLKPSGCHDFGKLQQPPEAARSCGSTIDEASSILNFSALNVRATQLSGGRPDDGWVGDRPRTSRSCNSGHSAVRLRSHTTTWHSPVCRPLRPQCVRHRAVYDSQLHCRDGTCGVEGILNFE